MSPGKIVMEFVILALLITAIVLLVLHFQKKKSIDTLNSEIDSIEKELAANQNLSASERARLEQALANLRAEKAKIEKDVAELERQKKEAEERVTTLEEKIKNTPTNDELKTQLELEKARFLLLQTLINAKELPLREKIKKGFVDMYNSTANYVNKTIAESKDDTTKRLRTAGWWMLAIIIPLLVIGLLVWRYRRMTQSRRKTQKPEKEVQTGKASNQIRKFINDYRNHTNMEEFLEVTMDRVSKVQNPKIRENT